MSRSMIERVLARRIRSSTGTTLVVRLALALALMLALAMPLAVAAPASAIAVALYVDDDYPIVIGTVSSYTDSTKTLVATSTEAFDGYDAGDAVEFISGTADGFATTMAADPTDDEVVLTDAFGIDFTVGTFNLVDLDAPSDSDPFRYIQSAIDMAPDQSVMRVAPGDYNKGILIDKSLTLEGGSELPTDTTIDPPTDVITIQGDDLDVSVYDFEICGGTNGIYINAGGSLSDVRIQGCLIHNNTANGISVTGSGYDLDIAANAISDNDLCGVRIDQAWELTTIEDNDIGAAWEGRFFGGDVATIYPGNTDDGIHIADVPADHTVSIDENWISENGGDGIDCPGWASVAGTLSIVDNRIGAGYYGVDGASEFIGNTGHGIHIGYVAELGHVDIEDNRIAENGFDGINFGVGIAPIEGSVAIEGNRIGAWSAYWVSGQPSFGGNSGSGIYIHYVETNGTVRIMWNQVSENSALASGMHFGNIHGGVTIEHNDIGAWTDEGGNTHGGNGGDGVYVNQVWGGGTLTIGPDNRIAGNTDNGIEIYQAYDTGGGGPSTTVHDNSITNNQRNGIELGTLCEVDDATISHNVISGNTEKGIFVTGPSDRNVISHNEIRDNADGIYVEYGTDNLIVGNTIVNNMGDGSGVHLEWQAKDNVISWNNIEGNVVGVVKDESQPSLTCAKYNWWGDASGPSGQGPGGGDGVQGNVEFEPWLTAPIDYELPRVQWGHVSGTGTMDAKERTDTEVDYETTDDSADITVALYEYNPGSQPDFMCIGKYVDLHVDVPEGEEVTRIELRVYYTAYEIAGMDESSLELFWWTGSQWSRCSPTGVNPSPVNGYSGYIWAEITDSTIPTIADLTGSPFTGGGQPASAPPEEEPEEPDIAVGGTVQRIDPSQLGAMEQPETSDSSHFCAYLGLGMVLVAVLGLGGALLALRRRRA